VAKRRCARGKQGSKPTVPERTVTCTFVGREFTQDQEIRPQSVCTTRLIGALPTLEIGAVAPNVNAIGV